MRWQWRALWFSLHAVTWGWGGQLGDRIASYQHDDGGRRQPATLFMVASAGVDLCLDAIAPVAEQLGLLGDAFRLRADSGHLPVRLGGTVAALTAGGEAAALLAEALDGAEPAWSGVDAADTNAHGAVLALTLQNHAADDRTAAAQQLCAMAAMLAARIDLCALYWSPAALWSSPTDLAAAVIAVERSGVPPVLHIIAFIDGGEGAVDGAVAPGSLSTRGLAWFAGQELQLAGPRDMTRAELMRRAARIAVHAMVHGPFVEPQRADGLETGEVIRITPATHMGDDRAMIVRVAISAAPGR